MIILIISDSKFQLGRLVSGMWECLIKFFMFVFLYVGYNNKAYIVYNTLKNTKKVLLYLNH